MARKKKSGDGDEVLARNRSASHEYLLLQRLEAGIVLTGPEVKSARQGKVSLKEAYARVRGGEIFLHGAHFTPYRHARLDEADPVRPRKLLLHAREIRKLGRELVGSSMTLVATRMYLKSGLIKVEIALARGKKLHDKRESSRKNEMDREMRRARGAYRD